jgi:hypothetical protein
MDRNKLICAHFDAHSDLVWVTKQEPKFKQAHLDAAEMEEYRDAWRALTEARDWDRWQEKVKGMTDGELQREIAECHAEIAFFRTRTESDRDRFKQIMDGQYENKPAPQATKDRGKER